MGAGGTREPATGRGTAIEGEGEKAERILSVID